MKVLVVCNKFLKNGFGTLLLSMLFGCSLPLNKNQWGIIEKYSASNTAKYYEILQSIDADKLEEARAKIITYQNIELITLDLLEEEYGLEESSRKILFKAKDYNSRHNK